MSSNHSYKLYYFQARGAAEALRIIFALKGVEYEDIRISSDEWPSKKGEMPQGMMPVLEIDGVKHCQSGALFRFLGNEFGLYGKNNFEKLVIDEVCESFVDMTKELGPFYSEMDQEKKKEGLQKFVDGTIPKFLPFICQKLKDNGTGYLVGDSISIGDIAIYRTLEFLKDFIGKYVTNYDQFQGKPELKALSEKVASNPKISAWIAKRPQTAM